MHAWQSRYGIKPRLRVYTSQPALISDSLDRWTTEFCWPLNDIIHLSRGPNQLEVYVSRAHDLKLDPDCGHCLYIPQPQALDLSDLYTCMDLAHTMYYDRHRRFAVYRRDQHHLIKIIDVEARPRTGVIFMDCWESNLHHEWQYDQNDQPHADFYRRMIDNLWQYNLHSLVFFLSEFDPKPLANCLIGWSRLSWSVQLANLDQFREHVAQSNIHHWILVGGHWRFCTHDKELGFKNLARLKQQNPVLRFYSIPDSTAKFIRNDRERSVLAVCGPKDYEDDTLAWQYQSDLAEMLGAK